MDLAYSSSLSQKEEGRGERRRKKAANLGRGRVMRPDDGCRTARRGKG